MVIQCCGAKKGQIVFQFYTVITTFLHVCNHISLLTTFLGAF